MELRQADITRITKDFLSQRRKLELGNSKFFILHIAARFKTKNL
jgi:hypothetical protein